MLSICYIRLFFAGLLQRARCGGKPGAWRVNVPYVPQLTLPRNSTHLDKGNLENGTSTSKLGLRGVRKLCLRLLSTWLAERR